MTNAYNDTDPLEPAKKLIKSVEDGPARIGNAVVDGLAGMGGAADKVSKAPGKFRKAVAKKFGI